MRVLSIIIVTALLLGSGAALLEASPVSARVPLTWEQLVLPSRANEFLEPGLNILDFDIGSDGTTVYAVGQVGAPEAGATATVTTAFVDGGDGLVENYAITYTNGTGVAARAGTLAIPAGAAVGTVIAVTLAPGDTSIDEIFTVAPAAGNDAISGAFTIASVNTGVNFGTYTVGGTWAGTGNTVYDHNRVYKSTSAGRRWKDISNNTGLPGVLGASWYVAIAPDDVNTVVIADRANLQAFVTTDGGRNWGVLPAITSAVTSGSVAANAIFDLAVSAQVPPPPDPGIRYIACPGNSAAGAPAVYYFDLGAAVAGWRDAVTDFGTPLTVGGRDTFWAIEFSPNFSTDLTAAALCETTDPAAAGGGMLELHVLSFNQQTWNAFAGYPRIVDQDAAGTGFAVQAADIDLAPDYVGNDGTSRVAFVGASILSGAVEIGGIYRCDDSAPVTELRSGVGINSVDFNGTHLVAGAYDTNVVWRSADPTSPNTLPSRINKRIGINDMGGGVVVDLFNDQTIVAWNGGEVLGAKQGAASAFSVSRDNGLSWNGISLMDSDIFNIGDFYGTPDSNKIYFCADDGVETSVYRQVMGPWERVLCLPNANGYILRGTPLDNDVIYVADAGGTAIYYSNESGDNRWYVRAVPANLTDLAAENVTTCHIATGTQVRRSTDSGEHWDPPVTPELSGSNIATIASIAENQLIVGGTGPFFSWSTDGGQTWAGMKPFAAPPANLFPCHVAASGLDAGDYIYAVLEGPGQQVFRWTVGDNVTADYKNLTVAAPGPPVIPAAQTPTGMVLLDGVLYVSTDGGGVTNPQVVWCLGPHLPGGWFWSVQAINPVVGDPIDRVIANPSALKVTGGASHYIWVVDNSVGAPPAFPPPPIFNQINTYWNTLAETGPTLLSPADGFINPVNPVTGRAHVVTFAWQRPSDCANLYDIEIYADEVGLLRIARVTVAAPGPKAVALIGPLAPIAFEYMPGATYYWRVRVSPLGAPVGPFTGPVYSPWSEMRSFSIEPLGVIPGTVVSINAPDWVPGGYDFIANVDIDRVVDLNAAQYDILFDPEVLRLDDITDGEIDSTVIPIPTENTIPEEIEPGHWRIVQSMGLNTVSGSGCLAKLHFHVIGHPGDSSRINITGGILSGMGGEIPATWIDDWVYISYFIVGDANGDGEVNVLDMTKIARIILGLD